MPLTSAWRKSSLRSVLAKASTPSALLTRHSPRERTSFALVPRSVGPSTPGARARSWTSAW
eukprot:4717111-Prymnesium_polylepis.1